MEAALSAVGSALPAGVRQSLQQVVDGLPNQARQLLEFLPSDVQKAVYTPEGLVLVFLTGVLGLAVLAAVIGPALSGGKKSSKRAIVLAGPCNVGKTTLFFQLCDGDVHNGTVTSLSLNVGSCTVSSHRGSAAVQLVDVPGHSSMHGPLAKALKDAAGVVFVVDSVEVSPHRVESAELLYEVLTNPDVQRRRVPVLIGCNKMDLELEAHSMEFIRKTLEKQLNEMRKTRVVGIGKEGGGDPVLGDPDKPFSFGGMRNKVLLCEMSAKLGSDKLEEVLAFVAACAR